MLFHQRTLRIAACPPLAEAVEFSVDPLDLLTAVAEPVDVLLNLKR